MLSRIILSAYGLIIEIGLWVSLLALCLGGMGAGYNEMGILGVVVGLGTGFLAWLFVAALSFGVFLIMNDIRKSVKAIEEANNK